MKKMKNLIFLAVLLSMSSFHSFSQAVVNLASIEEESFPADIRKDAYANIKNDMITIAPEFIVNASVHETQSGICLNFFGHGRTFINISPLMLGLPIWTVLSNPDVALTTTGSSLTAEVVFQTDQGVYRTDYSVPLNFNSITPLLIYNTPIGSVNSFNASIDANHRTNSDFSITYSDNGNIVLESYEDPTLTSAFTPVTGFPIIVYSATLPETVLHTDVAYGSDIFGNRDIVVSFASQIPGLAAQQYVISYENTMVLSNYTSLYFQNGSTLALDKRDTYVNYARLSSEDSVVIPGQMRWTLVKSEMEGTISGAYSHISSVHFSQGSISTLFNYVDDIIAGPYGTSYHYAPVCADMGLNGDVEILCRSNFQFTAGQGVISIMNAYSNSAAHQDWQKVNKINSTASKGSLSVASDGKNQTICWLADGKLYYKTRVTGTIVNRIRNTIVSASTENKIIFNLSGQPVGKNPPPGIYLSNGKKIVVH